MKGWPKNWRWSGRECGEDGTGNRSMCSRRLEIASNSVVNEDCLLYTSDAADDLLCVDLGGRRIIKKKENHLKNPLHSLLN